MNHIPQKYEALTDESVKLGLQHVISLIEPGVKLSPEERTIAGNFALVAHLWLLNRIADTRGKR